MFSFVHEQKDHSENDLRRLRERWWQGCVSGGQRRPIGATRQTDRDRFVGVRLRAAILSGRLHACDSSPKLDYWENWSVSVSCLSYARARNVIEPATNSEIFPANISPRYFALVIFFVCEESCSGFTRKNPRDRGWFFAMAGLDTLKYYIIFLHRNYIKIYSTLFIRSIVKHES